MALERTELWFNPEVLRWARERLRLTPEDVEREAQKLKRRYYVPVTAEEVRSWEKGQGEPSMGQLETLGEIYICPVGYFFLDSIPQKRLPLSFRGLSEGKETQLSSLTLRTLERFSDLARWTVDLIRGMEEAWVVQIRPGEVEASVRYAEEVALEYRQRLGWTEEVRAKLGEDARKAFQWWRRTLENLGIFCFEMPLESRDIRGASLWYEGYPFILVNHQDTEAASGRLFTLLHEFAHLISARGEGIACDFRGTRRGENPEPFANRFAARMLLTPDELRQRLRDIGEERYREDWPDSLIDKLRAPFMISRDVVAITLQEIELAPSDFYDLKRVKWEARRPWGRGGRRPTQKERALQELGYSLSRLLARASSKPQFSWIDAASVVAIKTEKMEEFLRWVPRHDE
jgi:Zn-dependent peptidase ImmA (M78 family)